MFVVAVSKRNSLSIVVQILSDLSTKCFYLHSWRGNNFPSQAVLKMMLEDISLREIVHLVLTLPFGQPVRSVLFKADSISITKS